MKKTIFFSFVTLCLLSIVSGCSLIDDIGDIFDVEDSIKPVSSEVYESVMPIEPNFRCFHATVDANQDSLVNGEGIYAIIITDKSQLVNAEEDGVIYSWPEIDFEEYSLIIGAWMYRSGDEYLSDQHIVAGKKSLRLYIEIKEGDGGSCDVGWKRFITVYPKLPDRPLSKVAWSR